MCQTVAYTNIVNKRIQSSTLNQQRQKPQHHKKIQQKRKFNQYCFKTEFKAEKHFQDGIHKTLAKKPEILLYEFFLPQSTSDSTLS